MYFKKSKQVQGPVSTQNEMSPESPPKGARKLPKLKPESLRFMCRLDPLSSFCSMKVHTSFKDVQLLLHIPATRRREKIMINCYLVQFVKIQTIIVSINQDAHSLSMVTNNKSYFFAKLFIISKNCQKKSNVNVSVAKTDKIRVGTPYLFND